MSENQPLPVRASWWRVLLGGLILYFISVVVLVVTANPNLFPTVVMLGSFLVPVTYVAFFYERRHLSKLAMPTTAMSFFYGGVLGVLAASLLEPIFVNQLTVTSFFTVGLIEEFAKILGVLVIARHWRHDSEMDGLILGAAAGMGFAALESTGYAFSAFLQSGGSLSTAVWVTLLRGLLSPVGHGTWTAILASVLFRESSAAHFRINRQVIGAYLTVVVLHALWDGLPGVVAIVFSPGLDVFIGQAIVGGLGLFILWMRWREARRRQDEELRQAEALEIQRLQAEQLQAAALLDERLQAYGNLYSESELDSPDEGERDGREIEAEGSSGMETPDEKELPIEM